MRDDPSYLIVWIPWIQQFVARVNSMRLFGVTVTSWWRGPQHNRQVGGSRESQHLFALAIDVSGSREKLTALEQQAWGVGLVPVMEPGHLHIQAFPAGALRRAGVTFV